MEALRLHPEFDQRSGPLFLGELDEVGECPGILQHLVEGLREARLGADAQVWLVLFLRCTV